jgi:hypothetical protein
MVTGDTDVRLNVFTKMAERTINLKIRKKLRMNLKPEGGS